MIYFFDEDTCKETYKEMEQVLMNKSLEEVWKIACTYTEHYIHTQQQSTFMGVINNINVQDILNMAQEVVKNNQEKINDSKG